MTVRGYARVSTMDQHLALQLGAMERAGVDEVYAERQGGGHWERRELQRLLGDLQPGDTLVVWKLDRLSRSLSHLLKVAEDLAHRGVELRSLTEAVDTTSAMGRAFYAIIGVFAELERSLIRERTLAGLEAAKAAGRIGGRRRALTPEQVEVARALRAEGRSLAELARLFGVDRSTIHRTLNR